MRILRSHRRERLASLSIEFSASQLVNHRACLWPWSLTTAGATNRQSPLQQQVAQVRSHSPTARPPELDDQESGLGGSATSDSFP